MKLLLSFIFFSFSLCSFAQEKITVKVPLMALGIDSGSFEAVSTDIKGNLIKNGANFESDKISVRVKTFKTGISMRDEHFWKHLNFSKFDKITLTDLKGTNGKASGNLEVNGVKKPVSIAFKESGDNVEAVMKLKNSDFSLPKASYAEVGVKDDLVVEVIMPFKKK